ncbi:MAG TPA: zinc ribbon domain-containing protein [Pyrinomonadaceae bacterium]
MIACPSCGAENVEGTRFCVKCGTTLPASPAPESWRQSGDLGQQQTQQPGYQSGGYTPPQQQQSSYPTYSPQQYPQQQQPALGGSQPMHPAVPAVVSLFLPGIGLLFVPNKAGLGIGIFAATIVYAVIATILTFVVIGVCLFAVMPLINVAAAVHSWDEAAKNSNGQFQPILFK